MRVKRGCLFHSDEIFCWSSCCCDRTGLDVEWNTIQTAWLQGWSLNDLATAWDQMSGLFAGMYASLNWFGCCS